MADKCCSKCGFINEEKWLFCRICGEPLGSANYEKPAEPAFDSSTMPPPQPEHKSNNERKTIFVILVVLAIFVSFSFLLSTHTICVNHDFNEATCESPKSCRYCKKTIGEALEHSWENATCVKPVTCVNCEETIGEALGHDWESATCTEPKTCNNCGKTEGTSLGHNPPSLTCTSSATCSRCKTLISAPGHQWSDATCTEPSKCQVCNKVSGKALGHTVEYGICDRCGAEKYKTVNGRGDDVVSNITVGDGVYRVHFKHSGSSNFIVKSYDATGDRELLINDIGNYDGYILLTGVSPFSIEIKADGSWSYTVERLTQISNTSFSGKGDFVTGLCSITSGIYEFTHSGTSNFIVRMYTTDGRDLLVNEIGSYTGKQIITIPYGSYVIFEIMADGKWTIKKAN